MTVVVAEVEKRLSYPDLTGAYWGSCHPLFVTTTLERAVSVTMRLTAGNGINEGRFMKTAKQKEQKQSWMAVSIPSSKTNPFVRPLALLALLAFPNDDETKDRLLLLRALLLQEQTRGIDPRILNSFAERKYFNILSKAARRWKQRQSAGRIAFFQVLNLKREGFSPTLRNQEQMERILLGWNPKTVNSDSTYKTKVWGRSRPVLHLAVALVWIQAFNEASFDEIFSHLVSSPDDFDYFLVLADNLRLGLPSVHRMYLVCTENPKSDRNGDEVRPGWHVNE